VWETPVGVLAEAKIFLGPGLAGWGEVLFAEADALVASATGSETQKETHVAPLAEPAAVT
jgi:hypothetical protein